MRVTSRGRAWAAPRIGAVLVLCAVLVFAMASVASAKPHPKPHPKANHYVVTNLVSDDTSTVSAQFEDPNLVNAWGIAAGPMTPWWVADNGTGLSTLYQGDGTIVPKVFSVDDDPTGVVFNPTGQFVVADPMPPAPSATTAAKFLFATESGQILGWNPNVPALGSMTAVVAVDRGVGAIYKGLALWSGHGKYRLYATDFHNNHVDVFDGGFDYISKPKMFRDHKIPKGYAPFGIQNIDGLIYVTYAKQDAQAHDEVDGPGFGFVDAFRPDGKFVRRVASRGRLNAPWGLAMAPKHFGEASNELLVGNFGSGEILRFAPAHRHHRSFWDGQGPLRTSLHQPIVIDGLWGIGFGNDGQAGPHTTLYFAAGPDDEAHGLFGMITR